ncbi:MAG: AAA family ATPase [Rhodospirillaceae bacterium]
MSTKTFAVTENVQRVLTLFTELEDRGAREKCLVLVYGSSGVSKTKFSMWFHTQNQYVYRIRAKRKWTASWMMRELLDAFSVEPEGRMEKMFAQAIRVLGQQHQQAQRTGKPFCVIIDEIDHALRNQDVLETIRDLSDILEAPFLMFGMERANKELKKHKAVFSRTHLIEFKTLSVEDIRKLAEVKAPGVQIEERLIEYIWEYSGGYSREIVDALKKVDRFGRRNGGNASIQAMAGTELFVDRDANPVVVPES